MPLSETVLVSPSERQCQAACGNQHAGMAHFPSVPQARWILLQETLLSGAFCTS